MEKINKNTKLLITGIVFFIIFSILPTFTYAANLFFSPQSGSYTVGSTIPVSVFVSSLGQSINAVSGIIAFPQDKLEVISLSKTDSIFSLWVQEPVFLNSDGRVNFEGIILNPGFTGPSGKIITINFKVKATGQAQITYFSGSVLANDGSGTNVLKELGNVQFSLNDAIVKISESIVPSITSEIPLAPNVSSVTHPDSNKWYSQKEAKFLWSIPSGITSIRLLVDKNLKTVPTTTVSSSTNEWNKKDLESGIFYFHIQFRNSKGWGEVSHYKFQNDTEPPKQFSIIFPNGEKSDNPQPPIIFNTTDAFSGISHYELKIGEDDTLRIDSRDISSKSYIINSQLPGKKTIIIKAFDNAENETVSVGEFEVIPLDSPKITFYSEIINTDESFIVEGETYGDSVITIFIKNEVGEIETRETNSNISGNFKLIWPKKMTKGLYTFSTSVTNNKGAKSLESESLTFEVKSPKFITIGGQVIKLLAVLIPLISLVLLLLFIVLYAWNRFIVFRRKIKKEVDNVESTLHKTFDLLKEDVQEQIKMFKKTKNKDKLTEEEEKITKQLKKDLDDAEKFIHESIEEIEY